MNKIQRAILVLTAILIAYLAFHPHIPSAVGLFWMYNSDTILKIVGVLIAGWILFFSAKSN